MSHDKIPCCAADALWRIRKLKVNGMMTGITRLDESIAAVADERHTSSAAIRTALMTRIRACNYIPPATEDAYAEAILEEYNRVIRKRDERAG
ncbi:hypothetical protein [Methanoregula sp.]|uniref:hypothetical protein n=1 Tax=Methanoregula sp. TaxID=2052170 RepID=UPI00356429B8